VVVILMTPSLLHQLFQLPLRQTQVANLAGSAGLCIGTVLIGAAADRFGMRRVTIPAFLLLIVSAYALYLGAEHVPSLVAPLYFVAGFGAGASVLTPILMVHIFPPAVRFTGVSFSYNVACALVGGITPLIVSWLAHYNRFSPIHYLTVVALCGLVANLSSPALKATRQAVAADRAA
jgi:MFS family permease